jgi:hypothetical protein
MWRKVNLVQTPQSPLQPTDTETTLTMSETSPDKSKRSSSFGISDAFITAAFVLIILSLVFNWMSDYNQPPEADEFDANGEPNAAYWDALGDHADKIQSFKGIYELLSSIGLVVLVAGLFFKASENSEHLPDWVRVALMAGTLYFMVRLFTTELSLIDAITLLSML